MTFKNVPNPLGKLESLLRKFPGVGEKSAKRIAIFLARSKEEYCRELAEEILNVKLKVVECKRCRNLGEGDLCWICSDSGRDRKTICVVATVRDLLAIEKSKVYKGTYFVLHGMLSPLEGMGPEELNLDKLVQIIEEDNVEEVIIATNPSSEGEATAAFISKTLKQKKVKITRISFGIPHGGEIEYADPISIGSSISRRHEY